MVKYIVGSKGSGKTKKMIDLANAASKNSKGTVVYIDKNQNHIYDLDRGIRLVDTTDFNIESTRSFYGFICGVISQNFDIEEIFVDGQKIISGAPDEQLQDFTEHLKMIGEKYNVNFVISNSRPAESIPEFLREYLI